MSHVLLMSLYAFIVSVFFAALSRRRRADQIRLFWTLFGALVGGAIALAWLMYFFPSGPPAPIP
ncbi:MAG: hypothetical protein AAGC60_05895 [Acidobacteriota bacterium]